MSATQPQPPKDLAFSREEQYKKAIHYTSLGALIICPLLILVPPRTTLRTSLLMFGTGIGANQLATEYSGESLLNRAGRRVNSVFGTDLPPKAQEMQIRLREEKARAQKALGAQAEVAKEDRSVLNKIWMGGEDEDWKRKRDEKEKEALEDGRGYGGLIMDQIWEVWNWGKKEAEELKEKDEEVVKAKKDGR